MDRTIGLVINLQQPTKSTSRPFCWPVGRGGQRRARRTHGLCQLQNLSVMPADQDISARILLRVLLEVSHQLRVPVVSIVRVDLLLKCFCKGGDSKRRTITVVRIRASKQVIPMDDFSPVVFEGLKVLHLRVGSFLARGRETGSRVRLLAVADQEESCAAWHNSWMDCRCSCCRHVQSPPVHSFFGLVGGAGRRDIVLETLALLIFAVVKVQLKFVEDLFRSCANELTR